MAEEARNIKVDENKESRVNQRVKGMKNYFKDMKKELKKIQDEITKKGKTVVPLDLYFNSRGLAKVKIAIAQGKNLVDKRETMKKRDWNLEKRRILAHYNSGK